MEINQVAWQAEMDLVDAAPYGEAVMPFLLPAAGAAIVGGVVSTEACSPSQWENGN
jgi:hypothetical protein